MTRELKPGDKISCYVEQQLPNCLLVRFQNGKSSNKGKVFRGVLVDESCPVTKRRTADQPTSKPALTEELTTTFIKDFHSTHISGKLLRNKKKPSCLVLDDFFIDYHNTQSSKHEKQFVSTVSDMVKAADTGLNEDQSKAEKGKHKEQGNETSVLWTNENVLNSNEAGLTANAEPKKLNGALKRKGIPTRFRRCDMIKNDFTVRDEMPPKESISKIAVAEKRYSKRNRTEKPKRFFGSEFHMNLSTEKKTDHVDDTKDSFRESQQNEKKSYFSGTREVMLFSKSGCGELEEQAAAVAAAQASIQLSSNSVSKKSKTRKVRGNKNDRKFENNVYSVQSSEVNFKRSPRKIKKRPFEAASSTDGRTKKKKIEDKKKTLEDKDDIDTQKRNEKKMTREDELEPRGRKEKTNENDVPESVVFEVQADKSDESLGGKPIKVIAANVDNSRIPLEWSSGHLETLKQMQIQKIKRKRSEWVQKVAGDEEKEVSDVCKLAKNSFTADMLICHETPFKEFLDKEKYRKEKLRSLQKSEKILNGKIKLLTPDDVAPFANMVNLDDLDDLQQKSYIMLDFDEDSVSSGRRAVTVKVSALNLSKSAQQKNENSTEDKNRSHTAALLGPPRVPSSKQIPKTLRETKISTKKADAPSSLPHVARKISVVSETGRGKMKATKTAQDTTNCQKASPKIIIDRSKGTVSISATEEEGSTSEEEAACPSLVDYHDTKYAELLGLSTGTNEDANLPVASDKDRDRQKTDFIENAGIESQESEYTTESEDIRSSQETINSAREVVKTEMENESGVDETCSETDDAWGCGDDIVLLRDEFDCFSNLESNLDNVKDHSTETSMIQSHIDNLPRNFYAELSFQRLVASAHAEKMKADLEEERESTGKTKNISKIVTELKEKRYEKPGEDISCCSVRASSDSAILSQKGATLESEPLKEGKKKDQSENGINENDSTMINGKKGTSFIERTVVLSSDSNASDLKSAQTNISDNFTRERTIQMESQQNVDKNSLQMIETRGIQINKTSDKEGKTATEMEQRKDTALLVALKNIRKSKTEHGGKKNIKIKSNNENKINAGLNASVRNERSFFQSRIYRQLRASKDAISGLHNMEKDTKHFIRKKRIHDENGDEQALPLSNKDQLIKPLLFKTAAADTEVLKARKAAAAGDRQERSSSQCSEKITIALQSPTMCEVRPFDRNETGLGSGCTIATDPMTFKDVHPSPVYTKLANENVTVKYLQFFETKGKKIDETDMESKEDEGMDDEEGEREKSHVCEWKDNKRCCCRTDTTKLQSNEKRAKGKMAWKLFKTGARRYPVVNRSFRGRPAIMAKKKPELAKIVQNMVPRKSCTDDYEEGMVALKRANIAREQGEELLKQMFKLNKNLLLQTETNQASRKGEQDAR